MERASAVAASAGGQARSMSRPAYVLPKDLRPINNGAIEMVSVVRKVELKVPVKKEVPNWLLEVIKSAAYKSYAYLETGWLAENSISEKAYTKLGELLEHGINEGWHTSHLAKGMYREGADAVIEWSTDGSTTNEVTKWVKGKLDAYEGYESGKAVADGKWDTVLSNYLLTACALGTGAVAPTAGTLVGVAAAVGPPIAKTAFTAAWKHFFPP